MIYLRPHANIVRGVKVLGREHLWLGCLNRLKQLPHGKHK